MMPAQIHGSWVTASLALSLLLCGCSESNPAAVPTRPTFEAGGFDPHSAEFKKRVQARLDAQERDAQVIEQASWFGSTGLDDEVERELPRYLRREFGRLLDEAGALKASNLSYLGVFVEGAETVRYWRIVHGSPEPKFAYVVLGPGDRQFMGWGNRRPPHPAP